MIDLKLLESITGEEINKFQTYAEEHQVFEIFQDIIRQLAIHQPKDPILWMANHLDKKQV
ncbi:hypothetical protein HMI55_007350 [Coelomomyces lativittatus]|nr:hypothetical protein HMI56_004576 [Coelomomyces lativittatus]KAJ1509532.1 hypothetical protein HMI55_007350 [Coelomomyces lativittatus]